MNHSTSIQLYGRVGFSDFHPDCAHNLRKAVADILFGPGHFSLGFNPYLLSFKPFALFSWLVPMTFIWTLQGPSVNFSFGESLWQMFSDSLRCCLWIILMGSLYQPNKTEVWLLPVHSRSGPASILNLHLSKTAELYVSWCMFNKYSLNTGTVTKTSKTCMPAFKELTA